MIAAYTIARCAILLRISDSVIAFDPFQQYMPSPGERMTALSGIFSLLLMATPFLSSL